MDALHAAAANLGSGPDGSPDRTLPQNIDAEQALLGAILMDNDVYDRVSDFLEPEHFYVPVHGRLYEAARTLIVRGQVASAVTLKAYFASDEALSEIGRDDYLERLVSSAVSLVHSADYGQVIADLSLRRDLIRLGEEVASRGYDPAVDESALDQIEVAEGELFRMAEFGLRDSGFQTFAQSLDGALKIAETAYRQDGQLAGVPTDFVDLDNLLGGLHKSDLIVLAGRPSMGKTALATNIAFNAAQARVGDPDAGAVVGFFSLEMSSEQLAMRILADEAGIRSDYIRRGKIKDDEEFVRLVRAGQKLGQAPLFIDDTPALSVSQLRTRARRLKRIEGLSLIIVDYLQLLRPTRRAENRVQEISQITQGLKALAKELDLPVLALSQLSRAVELREDKRPQLADLRESGTIEQDSDVVMFVYREEYYLERSEPQQGADESSDRFNERYNRWQERFENAAGLADVIIAKQRHGPIGRVGLKFSPETTRFHTYAADTHVPDQQG